MRPTAWRRAVVAVATIALLAASVVLATGGGARVSPADATRTSGDAIVSIPHHATLQATTRGRHTQLSARADQGTAKPRPVLFAVALVAGFLLAAAVAWASRTLDVPRPSLERRRRSLFLRGPPSLQLALIH